MKTTAIVIRKYGNRRLYNTSSSRYINLEELAQMVRDGNEVQVVDARTGEDLTRLTLTQIIVEDAKEQRGALPVELLRELVLASNHAGREFVAWYLKSAMDAYRKLEGTVQSGTLSPLNLVKNLIGPREAQPANEELERLQQRVAELEKGARTPATPPRGPAKSGRRRTRKVKPSGR